MGAFVDPTYVEKLQEDIKIGCEKLHDYGFESLVILVCRSSQDSYTTGSQRGKDFLKAKAVTPEFVQFCVGRESSLKSESSRSLCRGEESTSSTHIHTENNDESLNTPKAPIDTDSDTMIEDDGDDYDDTLFVPMILAENVENTKEKMKAKSNDIEVKEEKPPLKPGNKKRKLSSKKKKLDKDIYENLKSDVKVILTRLKNSKSKDGPIVQPMVSLLKSQNEPLLNTENQLKTKKEADTYKGPDSAKSAADASSEDLECVFCLRVFNTQASLDVHLKHKHERNRKKIKCSQCDKICESSIALGDHLATQHENYLETQKESFPCMQCSFVFSFKTHLVEHNQRNSNCKDIAESRSQSNEIKNNILQSEISYTDKHTGKVQIKTVKDLIENAKIPNTCEICLKCFDRPYSFRRHILHHSTAKHFQCNICLYEFTMEEAMKRHWKLHDSKPYFCSNCYERYETRSRLNYHTNISCKRMSDKPELQCPVCELQTNSRSALEIHMKSHAGIKEWSCDKCGKQLVSKESLHRHQIVLHTEDAPHQCEECGKKYKTKDQLKKHSHIHGDKKYKCDVCEYATVDFHSLKKHKLMHTKEKLFVCDFCGNSYARKFNLDNHRRLHTGERPYVCNFEGCGKSFRNPVNLKQHQCYHSSTYAFVCDFCGRKFKVRNAYLHHRRYHTVEFRWPCEYCKEKFKSRTTYKTHIIKRHVEKIQEIESKSTIKFYPCNMCPKIFSSPEHLAQHVNVHMGLKPMKCRYCGKGFSSKGNVLQHEKSHIGGKKFRCNFCSKSYNTVEMFKQHLQVKHAQTVDMEQLEALAEEVQNSSLQDSSHSVVMRTKKSEPNRQNVPYETVPGPCVSETPAIPALITHPTFPDISHIIGDIPQASGLGPVV